MSTAENAFRARLSDPQQDLYGFLHSFSSAVLQLLPNTLWERPLIIRSASGAGKTSLLRVFSLDSSLLTAAYSHEFDSIVLALRQVGAFSDQGPMRLGVVIGLDRDYRELQAVAVTADESKRLFFRLLDARVVFEVVRTSLAAHGLQYPSDAARVAFSVPESSSGRFALERLGGPCADGMIAYAHRVEAESLDLLDRLLPADLSGGHAAPLSLQVLAESQITVDGAPLPLRPLVMFDDGHSLDPAQRKALLHALFDRRLSLSRWYTERIEALNPQAILQGKRAGRDFDVLDLESAASGRVPRTRHRFQYERFVKYIGDARAVPALSRRGQTRRFSELLDYEAHPVSAASMDEVIDSLTQQIAEAHGGDEAASATRRVDRLARYPLAIRLRELLILLAREQLSGTSLGVAGVLSTKVRRAGTSDIRAAAALFLARESGLPYYYGSAMLARLSSFNVEQYLGVGAELFDEMLANLTLRRGAPTALDVVRQDSIVRRVSDAYWMSIPERVRHGRDVQRLVGSILAEAQKETYQPTAPHAPGVNGIVLRREDRAALLSEGWRREMPERERLFSALTSAIAENVLAAEVHPSASRRGSLVLSLNRLLCPRANLPLTGGSVRLRRLDQMVGWMMEPGAA